MFEASANFLNAHEWAYGMTEVAHTRGERNLELQQHGSDPGRARRPGERARFVDEERERPNATIACPATANGVKERLADQPDATARPSIMCAVSVAEATAEPPIGARSRPVVAAPERIDTAHALTSHHEPPL